MVLEIRNLEVERLAEEISRITGESKTQVIHRALLERLSRLREPRPAEYRRGRLRTFLEREVWDRVPVEQLGRAPDRAERAHILGYGDAGA